MTQMAGDPPPWPYDYPWSFTWPYPQPPSLYPREGPSVDFSIGPKRYNYSFQVWPDETWGFDPAVYELFKVHRGRIELEFSEPEFERFRSGLSHHGLTLREVERVPYAEPEAVP